MPLAKRWGVPPPVAVAPKAHSIPRTVCTRPSRHIVEECKTSIMTHITRCGRHGRYGGGKVATGIRYTASIPRATQLPAHLPRERVVIPGPTTCDCGGGHRLRKLGETVTETLEVISRQWKVISHVREKMTCRACEKISEPRAPFHVTPRGWAGPNLLAMLLFEKFGQHQPLNRQAERFGREGVPFSLSTLADQVGARCAVLEPLLRRVEAHVFAAERLHGDDTTVPVLAKGKTHTGRCWVYVRDYRPFGGRAPPAAMFYYSRDRGGAHVEEHLSRWRGILQADAYSDYSRLYEAGRTPGPIQEAACWAHARRPFFALADIEASARRKAEGKVAVPISPLALEAVLRIDALFEIERGIAGKSADERRAVRQELSRPLIDDLGTWMRVERPKLSRGNDLAKAFDYMLKRWTAFTRFLDDGRICLSNNAAERALRGIALGRKSRLFAGSDRGGQRAAAMYSVIVTAKLNDIDPQAWLADVLTRIAEFRPRGSTSCCRGTGSLQRPAPRPPDRRRHSQCRRRLIVILRDPIAPDARAAIGQTGCRRERSGRRSSRSAD